MAVRHAKPDSHERAVRAWHEACAEYDHARLHATEELPSVIRRRAAAIRAMRNASLSWREINRETGLYRERLEQILKAAELYD